MLGGNKHVSSGTLKNSFERRSVLIGGLQAAVGVLLAARMGWIALVDNEKYELASESNRVNLTLIPPRRGAIVDRNNVPRASNRMEYRIDIVPERLVDPEATFRLHNDKCELGYNVSVAATPHFIREIAAATGATPADRKAD